MSPSECNWEVYDKELRAIKSAFDTWHQYLLGAKEPVQVHSDHKNLTYWRKLQQLNHRQAWWVLELQDYNFILHHKLGKLIEKPDAISKRHNLNRGENDNVDVTVLDPHLFRKLAL